MMGMECFDKIIGISVVSVDVVVTTQLKRIRRSSERNTLLSL